MVSTEEDVGVTRFVVEDHVGFIGSIKHRYRDFLVNEVDASGNVVHLTRLNASNDPSSDPEPASSSASSSSNDPSVVSGEVRSIQDGFDALEDLLGVTVGQQVARLILGIPEFSTNETVLAKANCGDGKEESDEKIKVINHILLDPIEDKVVRGAVHKTVRHHFGEHLLTDTVLVKRNEETGEKEITKHDTSGTERVIRVILKNDPSQPSSQSGEKSAEEGRKRKQERGNGRGRKRTKLEHGIDKRSVQEREEWPADRPPFIKFVLYKENVEMNQALNLLGRSIGVKPANFETAGIKDKRGVTTQHVSTRHVTAKELVAAAETTRQKKGRPVLLHVGNFEYVKEPVKLGNLFGNRFTVVFRDLQMKLTKKELAALKSKHGEAQVDEGDVADDEDTPEFIRAGQQSPEGRAVLKSIQEKVARWDCFLNYFGMQRFGTTETATHQVGRAILQGDFVHAVKLICQARDKDSPIMKEALEGFLKTGNANKLLRALPSDMVALKSIAMSLSKRARGKAQEEVSIDSYHLNEYEQAINSIPISLRSLYVNAYQSYVFNLAVTKRVEEHGCLQVVPGDLVLKNVAGAAENMRNVKVLSRKDVEGGEYTIEDVVLPLVGHKITMFPTHKVNKAFFDGILQADGIDLANLRNNIGKFAPQGSYRNFLIKPRDVQSDFIFYNQEHADADFALTDLDKVNGLSLPEFGENPDRAALRLDFTLPAACYATMGFRELLRISTDRLSVSKPHGSNATDES